MTYKKLHLGCGTRNFGEEWLHVDRCTYDHIKWTDVQSFAPELVTSGEVEIIYASHLLEYFDKEEGLALLKKWYKLLKPGGILRLAVPDFAVMAELYVDNKFGLCDILGPLYGKMMESGESVIYHKTVYDYDALELTLYDAGFRTIEEWDWRKTEHRHIDDCSQAYLPKMDKEDGILISLNLEGIK